MLSIATRGGGILPARLAIVPGKGNRMPLILIILVLLLLFGGGAFLVEGILRIILLVILVVLIVGLVSRMGRTR